MKHLLYILLIIPSLAFGQTVSIEAADANGVVTNVKLDLEEFQQLAGLPSLVDKMIEKMKIMQAEIDSLSLQVFQDTVEIERLKSVVFSEPVVRDEYQIMLDYLRNNSLSAFNREYTETEIVEIALTVDELPAFMKSKAGNKSVKVDYLITLL